MYLKVKKKFKAYLPAEIAAKLKCDTIKLH